MKTSLIALFTCCAVSSAAFAYQNTPRGGKRPVRTAAGAKGALRDADDPGVAPPKAIMDDPGVDPPKVMDDPGVAPPKVMDDPGVDPPKVMDDPGIPPPKVMDDPGVEPAQGGWTIRVSNPPKVMDDPGVESAEGLDAPALPRGTKTRASCTVAK